MRRATTVVGDLSGLTDRASGATSPGWWGVVFATLAGGTGFVFVAGRHWLLLARGAGEPASLPSWGSLLAVLAVLAVLPNRWARRRAERCDLAGARIGLWAMAVIGTAMLVLRALEFGALGARWDASAYGSVVWAVLVLHTLHLTTGVCASAVRAVPRAAEETDAHAASSAAAITLYWGFIIWSCVAMYGALYLLPRWPWGGG